MTPSPQSAPVHVGVILDFSPEDRLEFTTGQPVTVVSVAAVSDVLAGLHSLAALSRVGATPGEQVGFDLNGDGAPDLYLLMAGPGASRLAVGLTLEPVTSHAAAQPTDTLTLSQHGLSHGEFLFG